MEHERMLIPYTYDGDGVREIVGQHRADCCAWKTAVVERQELARTGIFDVHDL